jgi:hypothetical protein
MPPVGVVALNTGMFGAVPPSVMPPLFALLVPRTRSCVSAATWMYHGAEWSSV